MESSESALAAGYRLDRYELLCPIASGGMASVWLARLRGKRGFEKLYAIKTIKTELISDANFQEMFLDEARIASRIIHPNVAQILELGEQDDILYIVMEFVEGDSLAKVNRLSNKRSSPLPPGVSLRIVAEMCAGLHAAHQLKDASGELLGVVHRDVSPQNVLVTTSGQSKIIDFGLVKARNRAAAETASGVVKGKIRYMAPEQVGSRPVDHRADIWAVGMCLYELITGQPPYDGEEDLDVVKRLMSASPLPSFKVALPPQLEGILARAIVADPAGRFQSCAAMRRAIEAAIHDLGLAGETDDVADFLRETLPELAAKRQRTIQKATLAADALPAGDSTPPPRATDSDGLEPGDIAFMATEVSARDRSGSDALPLTRRLGPDDLESDPRVASSASGQTPGATTLRDQLGERRKRGGLGYGVAAAVVVASGALILWPRETPAPTPSQLASLSSASSGPLSAPPPASAQTPPLDPASAAASASAAAAASASAAALATPIELDPFMLSDAGANTKSSGPGPFFSKHPRGATSTSGPGTVATPLDGGLSPGARAAAAIMLDRRPETPPPEEPPAPKGP